MIKINFPIAISLYLTFSILLVFTGWIFYNYKEGKLNLFNKLKSLQQCPFCTYVFYVYHESDVDICPKCKSYINLTQTQTHAK